MEVFKSAEISSCQSYRYGLSRTWKKNPQKKVCFIGLNPSTADAEEDDPTIRRMYGFARSWNCDAFCVANLFGFRATDPKNLKEASDPIGPENDHWIVQQTAGSDLVVCCWGMHGGYLNRDEEVFEILRKNKIGLWCLGVIKSGKPRHPLYVPRGTKLIRM